MIAARTAARVLCCSALCALPCGCASTFEGDNPSFAVSRAEASSDFRRMSEEPVQLDRPLVIIGGIGDPGISSGAIYEQLLPVLRGRIIAIAVHDEATFDGARQKVLRETAAVLSTDLDHLPAVDVVAFSMGGLVARDAAISDLAGRRLPVARLFTICSPHEGARMAGFPVSTPQMDDMTPTSSFIDRIRAAKRDYELVCYARLDDITVGEEFAAPEGEPVWWVPTPRGHWAHAAAFLDERILADIARRLRGEVPFSTLPAAPLPN